MKALFVNYVEYNMNITMPTDTKAEFINNADKNYFPTTEES